MESIGTRLEQQLPGFKASFGGEELKRATAALAGAVDMGKGAAERKNTVIAESTTDETPSSSVPSVPSESSRSNGAASATLSALLARTSTALTSSSASSSTDFSDTDLLLRELALAANQYARQEEAAAAAAEARKAAEGREASAGGTGPVSSSGSGQDYDIVYHHALVLQELAAKLPGGHAEQLQLLRQACELYACAAAARPSSHSALYNWGVALSDMARLLKESDPDQALSCLQQATHKYAGALDLQPGNPQALNNWGLNLQEMSGLVPATSPERDTLVVYALEKFRHAVRLRPDFDRGCYNMGTVLYSYACAVQAELAAQLKAGRLTSQDAETSRERHARETRVRALFTAAAQYICLAAALQPSRDIYRRSLAVVKPMLPLPFLRAGYLTAPVEHTLGGPAEAWRREWFVLDHMSLRSASALESSLSSAASGAGGLGSGGAVPTLKIGHAVNEVPLVVPLEAIISVRRCYDPSLPEGEALWLQLAYPLNTSSAATHPHTHALGLDAFAASTHALGTAAQPHAARPPADRSSAEPWAAAASAAAAARPGASISSVGRGQGLAEDGQGGAAAAAAASLLYPPGCAPPCCCVWLVADDADSADAWADALLLAHHVAVSRSPYALSEALTPAATANGAAGVPPRTARVSGGGDLPGLGRAG
ncbi:hypothetical protein CHLRE_09g387550v5 [Chlamydomonas reinhardtii]|uniref:PH domain-containing protein n=1 Tax=Chlamydomonas reinhardtii TaxID=3055 RepID=A0A2K3DDQ7_CHLRE|nr:uncharacterized protein CHLRE_09g387550v5 [Chlamydomonas reinhardtii]PNW78669.1 hypothetical protein CHLRE_09g387550v5 [Chlamydomonas reinhardtii]